MTTALLVVRWTGHALLALFVAGIVVLELTSGLAGDLIGNALVVVGFFGELACWAVELVLRWAAPDEG